MTTNNATKKLQLSIMDVCTIMPNKHYDVCIVGAGPAGLACLSAIREPYSIDHMTDVQVSRAVKSLRNRRDDGHHHSYKPLRVCVIDPNNTWLQSWKENFQQLKIRHLRSPAMAHPDLFDAHALLTYAMQHGRESELYESGCSDIKTLLGLGQTQVGLWKLPSTQLFLDFCDDMTARLSHMYLQGRVVEIDRDDKAGRYQVTVAQPASDKTTTTISVQNVILATGMVGRPVIPPELVGCPSLVSWKDPKAFSSLSTMSRQRVLVVGGGLTAVQVALRAVEEGAEVVLLSRRPLKEKHFDIPTQWFDRRAQYKCLADFYHEGIESRLSMLKHARDGGSVPPMYMRRLEQVADRLTCWVGDVEYQKKDKNANGCTMVHYQGSSYRFDRIILACGVPPDCTASPVMQKILKTYPISIHGGFPDITQDLQWSGYHKNIFVCGSMAALQVGPDAGNLMGIRRAALAIAQALHCRHWLRQTALDNPFSSLFLDDSDTESNDEDDCSSCCSEAPGRDS